MTDETIDELRRLREERDALRAVLRSLEWLPHSADAYMCPACHAQRTRDEVGRHASYCAIAAALAAGGKAEA